MLDTSASVALDLSAFVAWPNEGESQMLELPPRQHLTRHRTSRHVNYRLKFLVMRRDNFKCRITSRSPATDPNLILEVDHIVPWGKGGETVIENPQTLAKEINIEKAISKCTNEDEDSQSFCVKASGITASV